MQKNHSIFGGYFTLFAKRFHKQFLIHSRYSYWMLRNKILKGPLSKLLLDINIEQVPCVFCQLLDTKSMI